MKKKVPSDIKIVLRCRRCKRRIDPYWEDGQLQGLFLADDVGWSELLDVPVILFGKVVCANCLMTYS